VALASRSSELGPAGGVDLVGNSLVGAVAVESRALRPDLIRRLVLMLRRVHGRRARARDVAVRFSALTTLRREIAASPSIPTARRVLLFVAIAKPRRCRRATPGHARGLAGGRPPDRPPRSDALRSDLSPVLERVEAPVGVSGSPTTGSSRSPRLRGFARSVTRRGQYPDDAAPSPSSRIRSSSSTARSACSIQLA